MLGKMRVVNDYVQMSMNANGTIDNEWHLPFSRATHSNLSLFLSLVFFSFVFIHLLLFISLLVGITW